MTEVTEKKLLTLDLFRAETWNMDAESEMCVVLEGCNVTLPIVRIGYAETDDRKFTLCMISQQSLKSALDHLGKLERGEVNE